MCKAKVLAGLAFGAGTPKLCVPLTAKNAIELQTQLCAANRLPADLYEWRLDAYQGALGEGLSFCAEWSDRPILCTVRTVRDGGAYTGSQEEYEQLLTDLLQTGGFAMLDIEYSAGEERVRRLVKLAQNSGIATVVSHHNFIATPPEDEMVALLHRMTELGADLPKLAVMPTSPNDVLALLCATQRASEEVGPCITMSMGKLGAISRVCGELTGSCLTFGAGEQASAPGQILAETLRELLDIFTLNGGAPDEK